MSKELAEELRDIADLTNWEAMIREAADLLEAQQKRIDELERRLKSEERLSFRHQLEESQAREALKQKRIDGLEKRIDEMGEVGLNRQAQLAASQAQNKVLREALENCRLLAARYRKEEWAPHILRFCESGGSVANPLRQDDSALRELLKAERERCADLVFDMVQEERNNYCWSVLHEAQSAIRAIGDQ